MLAGGSHGLAWIEWFCLLYPAGIYTYRNTRAAAAIFGLGGLDLLFIGIWAD